MEKIMHIDSQISEELHSDFRWALRLKGETAKDVIAQLVLYYVQLVKRQVSNGTIKAR